jgi:hypothetical protein
VDRLRDVEELLGPADDPPLGVEADVVHERDERVVDLGHTAAEGRRRHVEDALAPQRLGQAVDLVDEAPRDERAVVSEALVAGVDEREHGGRTVALDREPLHEADSGPSSVVPLADLELVRERADDRDSEPALGEVVGLVAHRVRRHEALALVGHLDDDAILVELVHDLD